jgi:hypothetical protein
MNCFQYATMANWNQGTGFCLVSLQCPLLYSKCQSSIFLFTNWTKPYHMPVHKTCWLHACNRLTIKPEVRHKLLASAGQFASCSEDVNLLLRDKDLVVNYWDFAIKHLFTETPGKQRVLWPPKQPFLVNKLYFFIIPVRIH